MLILGSSNSSANEDMMSKIWTNGDTIIWSSRNIVGKGEIACYEQFLLFPQCFEKLFVVASKWVSMEWRFNLNHLYSRIKPWTKPLNLPLFLEGVLELELELDTTGSPALDWVLYWFACSWIWICMQAIDWFLYFRIPRIACCICMWPEKGVGDEEKKCWLLYFNPVPMI